MEFLALKMLNIIRNCFLNKKVLFEHALTAKRRRRLLKKKEGGKPYFFFIQMLIYSPSKMPQVSSRQVVTERSK